MGVVPADGYIRIPETLRPRNAINCARYICNQKEHNKFYYDFSALRHCPAFGMLTILNAIRSNIKKYPSSEHIPVRIDEGDGGSYAAYMGFFNSIELTDWNIGRAIEHFEADERVIPITKINREDLQKQYSEKTYVLGEMIELASEELALTLTQNDSSPVNDTLRFCIREIIRNTFEHSKSDAVWVCGQYWPTKNSTEIAIMDEGQGILNSLRLNRHYDVSSDIDANKLALQPGVSRMFGIRQDPDDPWQNSGYGLFMSSSLCTIGGHFIISSGADTTFVDSQHQQHYQSSTQGTIICLSLKTDNVDNLSNVLKKLSRKGEEISRSYGKNRLLTASKVSSIASIVSHIEND